MKPPFLELSDRDKNPKPIGYGVDFQYTTPQRRVPCVLGEMLAPRSADDIPPIAPEAMASVQAALTLLANLIADPDFNLFLGASDSKLESNRMKARDILLTAKGLAGILRVEVREDHMPAAWRRGAEHFLNLAIAREDEGTTVQLACLVLADCCEHRMSNSNGGPTLKMVALAENTIGVSLDEVVVGFLPETK